MFNANNNQNMKFFQHKTPGKNKLDTQTGAIKPRLKAKFEHQFRN